MLNFAYISHIKCVFRFVGTYCVVEKFNIGDYNLPEVKNSPPRH